MFSAQCSKNTTHNLWVVTWHVVECKGGAAELGSRQGHQQCTGLYIQSIIDNLRVSNKLSAEQMKDLNQLDNALQTGEVKSYKLKQPFNDDGTLATTSIIEYNL